MGRRKTTSPQAIERVHRQERALQLRLAGASYRAIGVKLDISSAQAHRDVTDALAEITREPAQAVLTMELGRLDQMLLGLFKDAVSGDVKAVLATLKIMDRRARYLGLDKAAPPDTSGEARVALEMLQAAILETADRIGPDPDTEIGGSEAV